MLSLSLSLLLFLPRRPVLSFCEMHTPKTRQHRVILCMYVLYNMRANIAAYFLLPLSSRTLCVQCVRFFVFSCAARFGVTVDSYTATWALLTVGPVCETSRVFVFRACPKARRCPTCDIDPTAAQLTTSLPLLATPSYFSYCVYFQFGYFPLSALA